MDIKQEPVEEDDKTESHLFNEYPFEVPLEPSEHENDFKDGIKSMKFENVIRRSAIKEEFAESFCMVKGLENESGFSFTNTLQATIKTDRSSPTSPATQASISSDEIHRVTLDTKKDFLKEEREVVILLENKKFHHSNFVCNICYDVFKSKSLLKDHKLSHNVETKIVKVSKGSVEEFKCNECAYKTTQLTYMKVHKLKKHPLIKPFKCDECNFSCVYKSQLKGHKNSHLGRNKYKCDQCSFRSAEADDLKTHQILHTKEKPYECVECDFKTALLYRLKRHRLLHSGEKTLKCQQCDFKTVHSNNLKRHKTMHSGEKPFECDQCAYKSASSSCLKIHKISHSNDKPLKCDECTFKTAYSSVLKQHKIMHSSGKQYKCHRCHFSSPSLTALKEHALTHSGEYP